MNRGRRIAPLGTWLIALVFALPVLLPLYRPVAFVEPTGLRGANEYHYQHDLQRFLLDRRTQQAGPRGVMLAMSAGNCATVGPVELTANGVGMYVAFYPDATAEAFDGLLDLIVEGESDFVVIQDTVLVLDRPPRRFEQLQASYAESRSYWSGQLQGLARNVGIGVADSAATAESWRCPGLLKQRWNWEEAVQATVGRINSYSQQRRVESIDLLSTFSAAGIPVIIVSPPANSYTMGYGMAVHAAAAAITAESANDSEVSLHRQSNLTPIDQFNDPMHLARGASGDYRQWLNSEIIQVLEEQLDD